jgi:phospholipase A-2-activating protein
VATINHVTFASCSRDRTVKIWQRTDSGYVLKSTFTAHQKFVNSVAYIAPSKDFENGLVVSGGSDHIVYAFDPFSCEIAYTLIGHEGNVCCLSTSLNGEIISGSWDRYFGLNVAPQRYGGMVHASSL